jgi:hypothetical protein
MANSTTGSLNMYFPAKVTVNYNPQEISTYYTRVVRKIRFPRSCSREERCYVGSGDTGV